jgi:hypothetical protein
MNDRKFLAWFVVLALFIALVGAPPISSARMYMRGDTIGEVDVDCLKGGDGQDDDDAWANGDGPPSETHEKGSGGGHQYEEARPEDGGRVTPVLPIGILFRILFARLFVL